MTEALLVPKPFSIKEYLALEEAGQVRHEFIDGAVYAMSGGSDRHNLLALELAFLFRATLRPPCQVFVIDMKLRLQVESSTSFYYPDVLVTCSPSDRASHYRESPSVLIEVLSPSTERVDRTEKLNAYTRVQSLEAYLLVAQDVPRIEVYRRAQGWRKEECYREHTLTIEMLGIAQSVEQIYRRVGFPFPDEERPLQN